MTRTVGDSRAESGRARRRSESHGLGRVELGYFQVLRVGSGRVRSGRVTLARFPIPREQTQAVKIQGKFLVRPYKERENR